MTKVLLGLCLLMLGTSARGDVRTVYLQDVDDNRIAIATVTIEDDKTYAIEMITDPFTDHFLSMRPFRCLAGPAKNWCHVPYPYEIQRDISDDMTDLEYDLMFVWKGSNDYGINMWNGVYYQLSQQDGQLIGVLNEMDMDLLSAPPAAGELRPLSAADLHESDPDSHWLPHLVIE